VLELFDKERYCRLPKKRMREDGLRKKVSQRSKSSRKGRGEIELELNNLNSILSRSAMTPVFPRRSSPNGRTRAESRACLLLSVVGSTGMPVARELL